MVGYRKLISEKNFLKVKARSRALLRNGTDLIAILYKDRTLIFKTASGTHGKRLIWTQTVQITDAALENILSAKSFKDVETLIKDSDLKISCSCPSWLYWGYKYMAWKRGYGLEREVRRPRVRNPYEQGYVCFVAGTQVLTPYGYQPIESINVGDFVFTHKGRHCKVLATSSHFVKETVTVSFANTSVRCTLEHPFLVKKDKLLWVPAGNLQPGDQLYCPRVNSTSGQKEGFKTVESLTLEGPVQVYNIEVQDDKSFIVEGVAVHNCKHLYLVLSLYPFWSKALASKFRKWAESKEGLQSLQNKRVSNNIINKNTREEVGEEEEDVESPEYGDIDEDIDEEV